MDSRVKDKREILFLELLQFVSENLMTGYDLRILSGDEEEQLTNRSLGKLKDEDFCDSALIPYDRALCDADPKQLHVRKLSHQLFDCEFE